MSNHDKVGDNSPTRAAFHYFERIKRHKSLDQLELERQAAERARQRQVAGAVKPAEKPLVIGSPK